MDEVKKIQIEGLGEIEVTEEGIKAATEKMVKSMKDSHDKVLEKGNEVATLRTERDELVGQITQLTNTPPPAQFTEFNLPDDEFVQAKDVRNAITSAVAKAITDVKNELQPTLQSLNASVTENQVALIKAKNPDLTSEGIQKVVAIQQTFRPELMKSMLVQMGHTNVQSVSPEDMALYIYEGIQKGFTSGDSRTGIQKQGVRTGGTPQRDTDDDKLTALGKTDKEIAEIKQLCADTKMTIKEWIEHYHPLQPHTAK